MKYATVVLLAGLSVLVAMAIGCREVSAIGPDSDTGDTGGEDNNTTDFDSDDNMDTDTNSDPGNDTDTDTDTGNDTDIFNPGLRAASGCDEVADLLRQKIRDQMTTQVEENRAMFLRHKEMQPGACWDSIDAGADLDTDTDADTDGDSDGASDYSTTNNQVEGVDEPDFVKNDGNYVYLLADGRFQVLDAWPATEAHRISATAIEGEPKRMFVLENRAVIYSSLDPVWTEDMAFNQAAYSECTYGYNCELVGDGRPLKITVLDITDLTSPAKIREIDLSGSFLAGRSIDGTTYTMVVFPEVSGSEFFYSLPFTPTALQNYSYSCGDDLPFAESEIEQEFDVLIAENTELIEGLDPEMILPSATDKRLVNGAWVEKTNLFAECAGYYITAAGDGMNQLSLFTFDPSKDADLAIASIVDRPGAVYANADSFYIASRHHAPNGGAWYFDDYSAIPEATTVHKFSLETQAMTATYQGSGVVKGRVLNQFSMSEKDGYLRIATTTGFLPDPNTHSTVSVLHEAGEALETVGEVDNIAPSEDIRSVRFSGDQGYVVTFKKTDPLFVLDLADPASPKIVGELQIPGFSTYLHLMDTTHLLSIGYDADDMGDFAWFDGVMLQIFDISEPTNPLLDYKEVIGTRGSSSEALINHLAFNYFSSRDLLAIPITICEGGGDGTFGYDMTFSGLLVYNVTIEAGFTELGGVPHAAPTSGDDYNMVCGNWWTDASSAVKRSIFMEDYVFSIAPNVIKVASVGALSDVLVSLDLTAP